jgi:hypothetical protein
MNPDKIKELRKVVKNNIIRYTVVTECGDTYHVAQVVNADYYRETIYFIMNGRPCLVRECLIPINKLPEPNFEKFIEGDRINQ